MDIPKDIICWERKPPLRALSHVVEIAMSGFPGFAKIFCFSHEWELSIIFAHKSQQILATEMKRRDFLKFAGTSSLFAVRHSILSFSQDCDRFREIDNFLSDDYPFPYDPEYFAAAERFVSLSPQ